MANRKLTIEEMRTLAAQRGGECLSRVYVGSQSPLQWRGSCGHVWFAAPFNIKLGRWCPECGAQRQKEACRKTEADYRKLAEERGITFPQQKIGRTTEKVEWICALGHSFYAPFCEVKDDNRSCPQCHGFSIAEGTVRGVMKQCLGVDFPKARPEWLRGSRGKMELDGYNETLKLGFEYQGVQHYKPISFWGGLVGLQRQQERDQEKHVLCEKHGVKVVYVPYWVTDYIGYIKAELERLGFEVKGTEVNPSPEPTKCLLLEEARALIEKRGGRMTTIVWPGARLKIEYTCCNGHAAASTLACLRRGYGCNKCLRSFDTKTFLKMKKDHEEGMVQRKLAAKYQVSCSTVCMYLTGQRIPVGI